MKRIFTSICLGFALILTASAQERHQNDNEMPVAHRGNARASSETAAPARRMTARTVARPAATQRRVSTQPSRQRTYAETRRTHVNATVRNQNTANARVRTENARVTSRGRVENNVAVNHERNVGANRENANRDRNLAANRDRNMRFNERSNEAINRNRNAVVTNNWHGNQFNGRQYAVFRNYHRQWHDRGWWRHHYSRIIFVDGGWWFWSAGYWFPAWGYAPYAYYPYDGPIYGYSDLRPDQIVVQVQTQLQSDGYYAGPIDGELGPMTRQAIADFQADHNLAITSTVDEPTLDTLGVS